MLYNQLMNGLQMRPTVRVTGNECAEPLSSLLARARRLEEHPLSEVIRGHRIRNAEHAAWLAEHP